MADRSASSGQGRKTSRLDCFIRFDEVNYWLSRTRDLIRNAETYAYAAFRESFRQLRCEARKSEFALVLARLQFEREKEKETNDNQQG